MIRDKIIKGVILGVTAILAVSCSESYPGMDYDQTDGKDGIHNEDTWTEQTPIMVFVNEQNIFTVRTRGVGPFETNDTANDQRLRNSTFYVCAYRSGTYSSGLDEMKQPTDFRWYRYATNGPSGFGPDVAGVNCLLDGRDYNYGLPMYLYPNSSGELKTTREGEAEAETYYYSGSYQQVPYNFSAYYLDDVEIRSVNRSEERFSYEIAIDGSQDLMSGYAPELTRSYLESKESGVWRSLNEDEQRTILNVGGYCTFAAHRGIHPMINFKHLLTRLTFEAYPGDETAGNVFIDSITVESKYSGTFTVAARQNSEVGIQFKENRKPLALREASDGVHPAEPLKQYSVPYDESMADLKWYDRPKVDVGSCLLLAPDSVYTLNLYWSEMVPRTIGGAPEYVVHKDPIRYKLSAPHTELSMTDDGYWFAPGVQYPILIAVYGSQPIQVYANVEGWKQSDEGIHLEDPGD